MVGEREMTEDKDGCPQFERREFDEETSGSQDPSFMCANKVNRLLREWWDNQQLVYAEANNLPWHNVSFQGQTHTARLAGIRPIEDSMEKFLKDIAEELCDTDIVERARKLLVRNKQVAEEPCNCSDLRAHCYKHGGVNGD
jgi:hypothetical protein